MAAIMPEKSSLEPIGSVAANFSTTAAEEQRVEHIRFSHHSALADMIQSSRGDVAYADYIADMKIQSENERQHEVQRLARKAARVAAMKRCREQLKALVVKGLKKFANH